MDAIPCIFILMFGCAVADLAKDRDQCQSQLVGLVTCLPYVGGDAKNPTPTCCTGLKQVVQNSKICLCILVKDRNDPKLGLKINATLALALPDICHAPTNVSDCISLLHLAPHSPEAKAFEDFAHSMNGTITSTTANGNGSGSSNGRSAQVKSDSGRRTKWLGVEMAWGLLIIVVFHILNNL